MRIYKYDEYGVYAYRDIINNVVFYVGRQSHSKAKENENYLRAYDFYSRSRNKKCVNHIKTIGEDNVEVLWLYKTTNKDEKLFPIELKFQEVYYNIYKDLFLCDELSIGEFNSNYGKKWTEEKRRALSEKKKALKQSSNEKNSMAKEVVLISPDGKAISFSMVKTMKLWIKNNMNGGINYFPLQINKIHDPLLSAVRHNRKELSENLIGYKYMYKDDYVAKCGETIETHITYEEVE